MDVRNPDQVETAVSEFAEANGGLDIVVSGAAGNLLAEAIYSMDGGLCR